MTKNIALTVNDTPVSIDYFVQGFIDHTVTGFLEALEGTGDWKELRLTVDGSKVNIELDGSALGLNRFASSIVRNTVTGMVSTLKGVNQVNKLQLSISR